jgi:hypothetical protein
VASRRKAAQADPAEVKAPFLAEGEARASRAWRIAVIATLVEVGLAAKVAAELSTDGRVPPPVVVVGAIVVLVVTGVTLLLGSVSAEAGRAKARLAAARALLDAGCHDAAISELKTLHKERDVADEADWLVAQSYDRQGARRLALESYRAYLETHRRGAWRVEAKVRAEELEAGDRAAAAVDVKMRDAHQADATCPFCKSPTGDDPTVACDGCGTAHHAGCWEEQRGCSVFGCASRDAKAVGERVRE